jgi:hypothetical protein
MLINLPQVTLFAIDCVTPLKTARVMLHAARWIRFGEVVMATDTSRHTNLPCGIRYAHRVQSHLKVPVCGLQLPLDYELDVLMLTPELVSTPFVLHMEWDSLVANAQAWDNAFFGYDYVGAPWPLIHEPGWPAMREFNRVGNGGFALKSKRFCQAVAKAARQGHPSRNSSDRFQCKVMAGYLKGLGLRYAPAAVAGRFSCENLVYSGQFGLHGKGTLRLNGIDLEGI